MFFGRDGGNGLGVPAIWKVGAAGVLRHSGVTMAEVLRREVFSYSSVWGALRLHLPRVPRRLERAHIRIDVLFHFVPQRIKSLLYIFGDLVMVFVAVLALYWSWKRYR